MSTSSVDSEMMEAANKLTGCIFVVNPSKERDTLEFLWFVYIQVGK